jgi:hypothetical protein
MLRQPERLAEGEYRGFTYYVLTLGTHPCAYIDVTGTLLDGKGYDDIDIDCHFGLTYAEPHLSTVDTGGWFIGWDYAHYGDFVGYTLEMPLEMQTGKKWTTEEMVTECKYAIDQIIDKGFANRKQSEAETLTKAHIQAHYEAIYALADMVCQFGYSTTFRKQEAVCDGGLSALEHAFGALLDCGCKMNSNGTITLKNLFAFQEEIQAKMESGE